MGGGGGADNYSVTDHYSGGTDHYSGGQTDHYSVTDQYEFAQGKTEIRQSDYNPHISFISAGPLLKKF